MKKIILFLIPASLFFSCVDMNTISGSGNIVTEKRNTGHFDGLKTSGSIDVEIRNGEANLVEVEADDNVQQYIITDVSNGIFTVKYKSNTSFSNSHVKVYVTAPSLQKITVAGSGSIISMDTVKNNGLIQFNIDGSGDIKVLTDAPSVKAQIAGSGNITLAGRTKNFDGQIRGNGDLKCHNLLAENATIQIMGSGSAHVFSSVSLTADTKGSGDIYYSGKPASTKINKMGSGEVRVE